MRAWIAWAALLAAPLSTAQDTAALLAWAEPRLASPEAVEREASRRVLAWLGPRAYSFLAAALSSPEWRVREGAILALAWTGDAPSALTLARLRSLADDPAWPVRRALGELWALHGLGRDLPLRLLQDPLHDVRASGLLALAAQEGVSGPELETALVDRALPVRLAALRALVAVPEPPRLSRIPGQTGDRARRRVLRALAERPAEVHIPLLRSLLAASGGSLGEKLLALQGLRPLGSRAPGDGDLVLLGLQDPSPAVRGAAVQAGLLLQAEELLPLLPPAVSFPDHEGWMGFLKLAGPHAAALGASALAEAGLFLRRRAGERRVLETLAGPLGLLPPALLAGFDWNTSDRIQGLCDLARRGRAPALSEWLLAVLAGPAGPGLRDRLLPELLEDAGREEVAARLLSLLPDLPGWRQPAVVAALVGKLGPGSPELLLEPLERGVPAAPRDRRDYLRALADFPATPRHLALLRRLAGGDPDPGVRVVALAALRRSFWPPGPEERALLAGLAAEPPAGGEALRRGALEGLAAAGEWDTILRILADLPPRRRLPLQLQLAVYCREHRPPAAEELLRRWTREGQGSSLAGEAWLGLAALGREEAVRQLVRLGSTLSRVVVAQAARILAALPGPAAGEAALAWGQPDRSQECRETACLLLESRPDLPGRELLERLARQDPSPTVRGAALRALVARNERDLPEALLPELLRSEPESEGEGILRDLLEAVGRSQAEWAVPLLWQAALEPLLRQPLRQGSLKPIRGRFGHRAEVTQVLGLARPLFRQDDGAVAAGLGALLDRWRDTPGRGLLGWEALLALLVETEEGRERPSLPRTRELVARLALELPPPCQPVDLAAAIILGEAAEAREEWREAAVLLRRARRCILLGGEERRLLEGLLGEQDPGAGSFPYCRLAVWPLLMEAAAVQAEGRPAAAVDLARRARRAGGADAQVRRRAGEIEAGAGAPGAGSAR